jgi:hypothetical protein
MHLSTETIPVKELHILLLPKSGRYVLQIDRKRKSPFVYLTEFEEFTNIEDATERIKELLSPARGKK